jgi:hypothetical protein
MALPSFIPLWLPVRAVAAAFFAPEGAQLGPLHASASTRSWRTREFRLYGLTRHWSQLCHPCRGAALGRSAALDGTGG